MDQQFEICAKKLKFGTTTIDGKLDYSVYDLEKREFNPSSDFSRFFLRANIIGESNVNQFSKLLWLSVFADSNAKSEDTCKKDTCKSVVAQWVQNIIKESIDCILVEFQGWTLLRYLNGGPWPCIFHSEDLDYSNFLTFKDKFRAYALWDNLRWYSTKEEICGWNLDEIKDTIESR